MYDINNLCFLCLIYYKNKPSKGNNYLKVQDELQYLIPEKILNSSKTPKYVCSDCKENILNIKKFRDNYLKNILKYNELVQNLTTESDPQKCLSDNLNREYLNPTFTKIKREPCDNENLEILSDTEDFNSSKNEIKSTNVEQVLIKVEDTTDYYEENENSSPQDSNCVEQVEINNKNEELGQFLEINIQESSNKNYLPGNSATSQNDSNPAVNTCTQNEKLFQNAKTLEEKFKCNKCSKIYQSKKNLEKHSVIHLEHKCELCFKIFTQLNDLIKHVTTCNGKKLKACDVSDEAEKYPCELCGKSFKSASSLTLHKRVHTGERPYECDVCHKKFSSRTCLRVHKRLHTGEKPYVCDVCQKAFYIFRRLKVHYRTHTGEKPYGCDLCEKTFAQANLLKAHKRVHTGEKPYVCDVCQKAFTKWFTMKEHKRTHSDERPFTCDVCQKAFKTATGISQHKRIHKVTQEKKNE